MPVTAGSHREWARLGARARLQEIEKERAEILRVFPELHREAALGPSAGSRRPKRRISPAARKRMSMGMRKYWAERKAQRPQA